MDEFAQSREDDDLFADDFEPASVPTVTVETLQQATAPAPQAAKANISNSTPPGNSSGQRNQRNNQGQHENRRGGRGKKDGIHNGLSNSRFADPPAKTDTTAAAAESTVTTPVERSTKATTPPAPVTDASIELATSNTPAQERVHAVRGDRSGTGGTPVKKLTDAELTEKMEKMRILNAAKAERHRLSEADQAAFQQREAELAKKRAEEQRATRHQDMERAKNRQRKLQAQGGREWDSEKVEDDIVDGKSKGRSSNYVRGGHGGVIRGRGLGLAGSRFVDNNNVEGENTRDTDSPSSRGRSGFERGRGRGARGGRGGRGGTQKQQTPPSAPDFPALPTPVKSPTAKTPATISTPISTTKPQNIESPTKPDGSHDWAEEMATPVEEKKMAQV